MNWKFYMRELVNETSNHDLENGVQYAKAFGEELKKHSELNHGQIEIDLDDILVAFINGAKFAKSFIKEQERKSVKK